MRFGIALDLHARSSAAHEVSWANVRDQALLAERAELDLVVLPDHLHYAAGGDNPYAAADEDVGVRESMTIAAAIAATTSTLGVGHSVVNAPYRAPALLANIASTLHEVAGGRYSLGVGVGNSFDYDAIGVPADHRVDRFEEALEIVHGLLRRGRADVSGTYWTARQAALALRTPGADGPPLIVAAGGPRTMRAAVRFGDGWNGFCPTDPDDPTVITLLEMLDRTCDELHRDPATLTRTIDLAVDPLGDRTARDRTRRMLIRLHELGIHEVRCYASSAATHLARRAAIESFAEMVADLRTSGA